MCVLWHMCGDQKTALSAPLPLCRIWKSYLCYQTHVQATLPDEPSCQPVFKTVITFYYMNRIMLFYFHGDGAILTSPLVYEDSSLPTSSPARYCWEANPPETITWLLLKLKRKSLLLVSVCIGNLSKSCIPSLTVLSLLGTKTTSWLANFT